MSLGADQQNPDRVQQRPGIAVLPERAEGPLLGESSHCVAWPEGTLVGLLAHHLYGPTSRPNGAIPVAGSQILGMTGSHEGVSAPAPTRGEKGWPQVTPGSGSRLGSHAKLSRPSHVS
jgi:hypothetical protein